MGEWMKLTAGDGQELAAYVAKPQGELLGGLVVVQEIFGVNYQMRRVCDSYAAQGLLAVAPALFDRFEKGVELTYEGDDLKKAYELHGKLTPETSLLDVAAGFQFAAASARKTAVLGFCYGGFMSWLSSTRGKQMGMSPACCVGYYAGGIGKVATEEPSCPVMLHFGADDGHIGKDQIDAVHASHDKHPGEVQIFLYEDAGHGFANDARTSYAPVAAALAAERTLAFLKEHLG